MENTPWLALLMLSRHSRVARRRAAWGASVVGTGGQHRSTDHPLMMWVIGEAKRPPRKAVELTRRFRPGLAHRLTRQRHTGPCTHSRRALPTWIGYRLTASSAAARACRWLPFGLFRL
jgi:hypothetical protein